MRGSGTKLGPHAATAHADPHVALRSVDATAVAQLGGEAHPQVEARRRESARGRIPETLRVIDVVLSEQLQRSPSLRFRPHHDAGEHPRDRRRSIPRLVLVAHFPARAVLRSPVPDPAAAHASPSKYPSCFSVESM